MGVKDHPSQSLSHNVAHDTSVHSLSASIGLPGEEKTNQVESLLLRITPRASEGCRYLNEGEIQNSEYFSGCREYRGAPEKGANGEEFYGEDDI